MIAAIRNDDCNEVAIRDRYSPPRPLEEIEEDMRAIEQDIMKMLGEVTERGRMEKER